MASSSSPPGAPRAALTTIEDIFRCPICLMRVTNAQMCPTCSKMCCNDCISTWLRERAQCPNCRAPLHGNALVNCRFMADVSEELDKLATSGPPAETCAEHDGQSLAYYCVTCRGAVCSDCAMFGATHKGHEFLKLDDVYRRHCESINDEARGLRARLKTLTGLTDGIEKQIDAVTRAKEERSSEIKAAVEQMQARLDSQLRAKLVALLGQKRAMTEELDLLESMLQDIKRRMKVSPKSALIAESEELVRTLQELQQKPPLFGGGAAAAVDGLGNDVAEFVSEMVPSYCSGEFVLRGFAAARASEDVVFSEPLLADGLAWRLKVYPNGNGVANGTHLSVFVEMAGGLAVPARFEYRVELVNVANRDSHVVREYVSEFEAGECWGYNKLVKLDTLEREGFWNAVDDLLVLRFHVRPTSYFAKCADQARHIATLERRLADLEAADSVGACGAVAASSTAANVAAPAAAASASATASPPNIALNTEQAAALRGVVTPAVLPLVRGDAAQATAVAASIVALGLEAAVALVLEPRALQAFVRSVSPDCQPVGQATSASTVAAVAIEGLPLRSQSMLPDLDGDRALRAEVRAAAERRWAHLPPPPTHGALPQPSQPTAASAAVTAAGTSTVNGSSSSNNGQSAAVLSGLSGLFPVRTVEIDSLSSSSSSAYGDLAQAMLLSEDEEGSPSSPPLPPPLPPRLRGSSAEPGW